MYYGFDIGGTKIALGVFDQQRRLLWEARVATPHDSYENFHEAMAGLVDQADERFNCRCSVGIGILGMPTTDDGTLYAANVPAANDKPLRADLSSMLERDVRIDNDANCFALSEAWHDEFLNYPVVMGLILGTVVVIIINGKSVTGHSYITGEFGHTRLPVDALEIFWHDIPFTRCGKNGCIENYLSGRGFARLCQHFYHEPLDAKEIISRYRQGDEQVIELDDRLLGLLAACLGNLLPSIDPYLVVTGGGLSNYSDIYAQLPVAAVTQAGMHGVAFLHYTE